MWKSVDVLVGGQYGSEGKGQIAAHLCRAREYDVVMRVGGPNAGHSFEFGGRKYCFHQIPVGAVTSPESKVYIGAGAVIDPDCFAREVSQLVRGEDRVFVHPQAVVIEQADKDAESYSIVGGIGSTGSGSGHVAARKMMRGAFSMPVLAADHPVTGWYTRQGLPSTYRRLFLEGTQGSLLSLHHGRYPYVTSRDTTVSGCLSEAGIPPSYVRDVWMVCRTFPIRVASPAGGSSGPLPNELTWEEMSEITGIPADTLRERERTSTTKRLRRIGRWDRGDFMNAFRLNNPNCLALTFCDYLHPDNVNAKSVWDLKGADTIMESFNLVGIVPGRISVGFGEDFVR